MTDLKGNGTRPVDVRFRPPEQEIKEERYPLISIDLVDIRRSGEREHRGIGDLKYIPDEEGWEADPENETTNVHWPIPYDIYYTVMAMSRFAVMSRQIAAKLLAGPLNERFTFLEIPQDSTIRRLDLMGGFLADNVHDRNNKRVFRQSVLIRVSSEIPPAQVRTRLVTSVNLLLLSNTEIPSAVGEFSEEFEDSF